MAFAKCLKYKSVWISRPSGFEMEWKDYLLFFCGVDEAPFQSVNSKISAAGIVFRSPLHQNTLRGIMQRGLSCRELFMRT